MTRQGIEARFENFGRFIVHRRWFFVPLVLLFAGSLSSQAPKIQIDTSAESFLRDDDPGKILYDDFRDQFGRGEVLIAAVRTRDALAPDFLAKLRDFHQALEEEVPHLHEVRSLINARVTRGEGDELIVEELLEEWPGSPEEWMHLRKYVQANSLYRNLLISEDARLTTVSVESNAYSSADLDPIAVEDAFESESEDAAFLSGAENAQVVSATRAVVERFTGENFEIRLSGEPALQADIASAIQSDMVRFVAGMVMIIALLLFLLFRRISGILLPLVVVGPAVSGTIGCMAIAGEYLSAPSQILPSLLLAVGIGAAVHILTIFFQNFDAGETREDAIAHAMGHSGLPVCMTSITTAGGLLSFVTAEIDPVAVIGIFAPIGIGLALIYCLILLPALLAIVPLKSLPGHTPQTRGPRGSGRIGDTLVTIGDFSIRHAHGSVVVTFLVIAISLVGASQIRFGHDIMGWLPETHPIRIATALFDEELNGSMVLEIVADTETENGVQTASFLNALEAVQGEILDPNHEMEMKAGKVLSIVDVVKEINQALNANDPNAYRIPTEKNLIAQEILLFENSGADDLERLVDSQFQMARVSIRVPYLDPVLYVNYIEETIKLFEDRFGPAVFVQATGFLPVMSMTINALIASMTQSYILALLIITPLMILLIGSLRIGLVSMIPNLTPIIITLGIMGWWGIVIDGFTLMIGGIAIGLAVDDTIHYMHNFRRSFLRNGDIRLANEETLRTTGHALLVTSMVLSAGFYIFTFAEMNNIYYFGLLTSITIANAFLIDLLVSPALMALTHRNSARPS
ncbi:MAG TPA: hypothetical protein EYQ54_12765 [Myxococcales bacterium]|nr:hypothetical protein [Myxococcales bacterium]